MSGDHSTLLAKSFLLSATLAVVGIQWIGNTFAQITEPEFPSTTQTGPRFNAPIYQERVELNWLENDSAAWYRLHVGRNSYRYRWVDPEASEVRDAFDHEKLAAALREAGCDANAENLELRQLKFSADGRQVEFVFARKLWRLDCQTAVLHEVGEAAAQSGASGDMPPLQQWRRSRDSSERIDVHFDNRLGEKLLLFWVDSRGGIHDYGEIGPKQARPMSTYAGHAWLIRDEQGNNRAAFVAERAGATAIIDESTPLPTAPPFGAPRNRFRRGSSNRSPDERWQVEFENDNVVLMEVASGQRTPLTTDGEPSNRYGGNVWWSPDSRKFVILRTEPGENRQITMVDSRPDDQLQPKLVTVPYAKPGDKLDHPRPYLCDVESKTASPVDDSLFPNPYEVSRFDWRSNSRGFRFVYNQRGHQVLRVLEVDAETAQVRAIVDETSPTFINYSQKFYLEFLDDSDELIWMTERSGWNHLVLIEQSSGRVKRELTSGEWVVRSVERLDRDNRTLLVVASGMVPQEDVYHEHLLRVPLDDGPITRLTDGDGTHRWEFSPTGRWLIDRFSRVDSAPITELRNAETGAWVARLAAGDWSELWEQGWRPPERFVAKGRDDLTDIYGIIVRPTHFESGKRYPVLEYIYAGPQSSFVPKAFSRNNQLAEMAELGFIAVQIDGMGTSHRSKAFHDVCWKNLGDSGFPDRIKWIRAAAELRPEMDLSRGVGIWGGSAGGQSALRAVLAHGDFYTAAAADCGCHDNRMDKIWWNEQWMGWPIGPHYEEQSNVTQAHRLQGSLLLMVGELDTNVDPASTMQVVDALIRANKDFELIVFPGMGHGAGGSPYGKRRTQQFFRKHFLWER